MARNYEEFARTQLDLHKETGDPGKPPDRPSQLKLAAHLFAACDGLGPDGKVQVDPKKVQEHLEGLAEGYRKVLQERAE